MTDKEIQLSMELIREKIHIINGKKVMLDRDLAELYQVKAIALRQQVKRNHLRFPSDFMFQLSNEDVEGMVSQNVIPSKSYFGGSYPLAFTENGVAMLSSVLRSERAVLVNIQIMRTFTKIREIMSIHSDLFKRLNKVEMGQLAQKKEIRQINQVIEAMIKDRPKRSKRKIGFQKE